MKKYLLIIIIIGLLFSCQKSNDSNIERNASQIESLGINLFNGRMVFKDTTTFRKHLQWIYKQVNNNSEAIESFNKTKNFTSLMQIYNYGMNLEKEDFNKYLIKYPNAFSPIEIDTSIFYELPSLIGFAYIANKDGLFQIGDIICRITLDNFFEIINGDELRIPKLFLPINSINDKNIHIYSIHEDQNRYKHLYSYKTTYFSSKKRIVARLYWDRVNGGIGTYTEYSARTTSQRKRFGAWWQRKINKISVSWGQGYISDYAGNTDVITSHYYSKSNSADIRKIVYQGSIYPVNNNNSSCLANHCGTDDVNLCINNNEIFP